MARSSDYRAVQGVRYLHFAATTGEYAIRPARVNGETQPYTPLLARTERDAIEEMGGKLKTARVTINKPKPDTTMEQHWLTVVAYQDSIHVTKKDRWGDAAREQHIRHWTRSIEPVVGKMRVCDIEDFHCSAVLDQLRERGKQVKNEEGETVWAPLSGSTLNQCYMTMSMLFRFAKRGPRFGALITESPLRDIEPPEADPGEVLTHEDILVEADVAAILRVTPQQREKDIFLLADLTGLRASELLGLQLRHHDPKASPSGTLEIESQLRRRKKGDTRDPLVPVKGKKDIAGSVARVLKLSPAANRLLIRMREELAVGPEGTTKLVSQDAFFFTTRSDKPLSYRNVGRTLEVARIEAGIERPCTMHSFRHHYASRLFAAGATIEEVQHDLGHSSPEVTKKHYIRIIQTQAQDDRAAQLHAAMGLA